MYVTTKDLILAYTLINIENELYCYSNEFPNYLFYINYSLSEFWVELLHVLNAKD